jgi:hypothetical protein
MLRAWLNSYSKVWNMKDRRVTADCRNPLILLAEWTGLEPATPGVTGRYSNQLNYHSSSSRLAARLAPAHAGARMKVASPRGFEPL